MVGPLPRGRLRVFIPPSPRTPFHCISALNDRHAAVKARGTESAERGGQVHEQEPCVRKRGGRTEAAGIAAVQYLPAQHQTVLPFRLGRSAAVPRQECFTSMLLCDGLFQLQFTFANEARGSINS